MAFWENLFGKKQTTPADTQLLEEMLSSIGEADTQVAGIDSSPVGIALSNRFKEYQDLMSNNYQANAALGAAYTKVLNTRRDVIRAVDEIKPFYITDTLLSQFADDALAPDTLTDDVITIRSDDPTIDKELRALDEKFHFDSMIIENVTDILAYGEYTLRCTVKKGEGLVELTDSVNQANVVSLSRNGEIEGFLELDHKARKLQVVAPYNYVKFAIPSYKVRIDLMQEMAFKKEDQDKLNKIPRYIRVGKSLIYPIIAKIKELELLEQLIPATNLAKLTSGTLLGVQVPQGLDPAKGMEVAKKLEGLINKKVGVNSASKNLTVENILSSAGRLKVIPVFGEKGQVTKFDYKQDEPTDLLASVQDVRKTLCSAMGVPYELIFGGESDDTRGHLLKRYARYLRKLKQIQKAIGQGIKQICIIHLINKGMSFKQDNIIIEFRNKLIDIDSIDKLEFLDTSVQMLSNAKQLFLDLLIDPQIGPAVKVGPFLKYVGETFATLGILDVIDQEIADKIRVSPTPVEVPVEGE